MKKTTLTLILIATLILSWIHPLTVIAERNSPSLNVLFCTESIEWLELFNEVPDEEKGFCSYIPLDIVQYLDTNPESIPYELEDVVKYLYNNDEQYYSPLSLVPSEQNETRSEIDNPPGGLTLLTGGYELPYNPSWWNNPSRVNYANCYFYSINRLSTSTDIGHQQMGYVSNTYCNFTIASSVLTAISNDASYFSNIHSIRSSSGGEVPGYNEYKIAYFYGIVDYHWYRQNPDGSWSHKRGHNNVTKYDQSGNIIYNPQTCDRNYGTYYNYSNFVGYYIVRYQ